MRDNHLSKAYLVNKSRFGPGASAAALLIRNGVCSSNNIWLDRPYRQSRPQHARRAYESITLSTRLHAFLLAGAAADLYGSHRLHLFAPSSAQPALLFRDGRGLRDEASLSITPACLTCPKNNQVRQVLENQHLLPFPHRPPVKAPSPLSAHYRGRSRRVLGAEVRTIKQKQIVRSRLGWGGESAGHDKGLSIIAAAAGVATGSEEVRDY